MGARLVPIDLAEGAGQWQACSPAQRRALATSPFPAMPLQALVGGAAPNSLLLVRGVDGDARERQHRLSTDRGR